MNTLDSLDESESNYQVFRDCVFAAVVDKASPATAKTNRRNSTRRRHSSGPASTVSAITTTTNTNDPDPAELADFSDYISSEIFPSLPRPLRTLNYTGTKSLSTDTETYSLPLTLTTLESLTAHFPPSVSDTLQAYHLTTPPTTDTLTFLSPILTSYISTCTAPPPPPSSTRTSACELCLRDWIPLTYHHLIPKSTHVRARKRGWHEEGVLNSVAWLCRACHSFVHRAASNEELAREWFTVERLRGREDVERWCKWVGGVRWKKR